MRPCAGNILVTRNCEVRISDFGLAREKPPTPTAETGDEEGMTEVTEKLLPAAAYRTYGCIEPRCAVKAPCNATERTAICGCKRVFFLLRLLGWDAQVYTAALLHACLRFVAVVLSSFNSDHSRGSRQQNKLCFLRRTGLVCRPTGVLEFTCRRCIQINVEFRHTLKPRTGIIPK